MKKLAILGVAGLIFGFVIGVVLLKITFIHGVYTDIGVVTLTLVGFIGSIVSKEYYTLLAGSGVGCCGIILYGLGISTIAGHIIVIFLCSTLIITMIRMLIQGIEKSR